MTLTLASYMDTSAVGRLSPAHSIVQTSTLRGWGLVTAPDDQLCVSFWDEKGFARIAYTAWSCLCCLKERDSCPNRPPNRLQISTHTKALPTTIRADGQNKGKPRPKHLNSFYLKCERSRRIFLRSDLQSHTKSLYTTVDRASGNQLRSDHL